MINYRIPNRIAWPLLGVATAILLFFPLRDRWLHSESDRRAIETLKAIDSIEQLEQKALLLKTTDGGWIAIAFAGPGWHIFAKDSDGRWYRGTIYQGKCYEYRMLRRKWREGNAEDRELLRPSFEAGESSLFRSIEEGTMADATPLLSQLRFEEIPPPR